MALGRILAALTATAAGAAVAATMAAPAATAITSTTPDGYLLRVGSFNVRSVQFDYHLAPGEQPWLLRRGAVVSTILGEHSDVVGLQEASQNLNFGSKPGVASHYVNGHGIVGTGSSATDVQTQYFDIRNGLNDGTAGRPWRMTNPYLYNCVRLTTNTNCVPQDRGASRDTKIVYRTDRLTMLDSGSYLYRTQSGGLNDGRYFVWAKFSVKSTGKQFFFATTHLMNGAAADRQAEWQEVITKTNQLSDGLPVVITGDFQSSKFAAPSDTMMQAMKDAGYGDVVNQTYGTVHLVSQRAQTMVNAWINSMAGIDPSVADYSYENNRSWIGNNIDWVFASNSLTVTRWKVCLKFDPTTLQRTGVIPSDHNMVASNVIIPN